MDIREDVQSLPARFSFFCPYNFWRIRDATSSRGGADVHGCPGVEAKLRHAARAEAAHAQTGLPMRFPCRCAMDCRYQCAEQYAGRLPIGPGRASIQTISAQSGSRAIASVLGGIASEPSLLQSATAGPPAILAL
jgi:hypothetical protein